MGDPYLRLWPLADLPGPDPALEYAGSTPGTSAAEPQQPFAPCFS
jgi:hypothetical protein